MPPPTLWNGSRRLAGNLAPLAVVVPGLAWTLMEAVNPSIRLVWAAGATLAAGWLAVNLFGLVGTRRLKRDLIRSLKPPPPEPGRSVVFCGFARPSFRSALDPHEDLGFLVLSPESVEFRGELHHVRLNRHDLKAIRMRPNVHSLLGLGGWMSFEVAEGRLLVEPRERPTHLGNLLLARRLVKEERRRTRSGPRSQSSG
ncbi:MAG: hypothetical protein MH204_10020 [Fimbriimonadaceae bacterium]|nr:hypothetical protein [Fimbriimonadaceae bacterium]